LCVGFIGTRKGQRYLIDAVDRLRRGGRDIRLTLCGRGDTRLLREIERLDWCTHILHVPRNKMIELMQSHHILILPSVEDGFGLVVPEALSAGIPVLVSRNAGSCDLVRDGINGYTFEACNADAIVEAIEASAGRSFDLSGQITWTWAQYANRLAESVSAAMTANEASTTKPIAPIVVR
jgi:glycosyltransferase involved in cell wall biosynthesis